MELFASEMNDVIRVVDAVMCDKSILRALSVLITIVGGRHMLGI